MTLTPWVEEMHETRTDMSRSSIRDSLLVFASIVVILAGARHAAHLLVPFLLAVFFLISSTVDDFASAMPGYERQFTDLIDQWTAGVKQVT